MLRAKLIPLLFAELLEKLKRGHSRHNCCATFSWKYPIGHRVQFTMFCLLEYCPAAHSWHNVLVSFAFRKVPSLHVRPFDNINEKKPAATNICYLQKNKGLLAKHRFFDHDVSRRPFGHLHFVPPYSSSCQLIKTIYNYIYIGGWKQISTVWRLYGQY